MLSIPKNLQMKKNLLSLIICVSSALVTFAQTDKLWKSATSKDVVKISKTAQRDNFPQDFKLYQLNLESIRIILSTATDRVSSNSKSAIVTIPNTNGELERFQLFEASNFSSELQAQFPDITMPVP